jgi:hypothetical protein
MAINKPQVIKAAKRIALLLLAYALVMSPWYGRNLMVWGSLYPPGTSRAMWMVEYNQLFIYPPDLLSFDSWLKSGGGSLLSSRWQAVLENGKTLVGVQTEVFLLPLVVWGAIRLWRRNEVRLALLMELVTFGVMSLVFPLAGWRGGFLHSGAALQPMLWVLVPEGLAGFVQWGVRFRKWQREQAFSFFAAGLVLLAAVFSAFVFQQRVVGSDVSRPLWGQGYNEFRQIKQALVGMGLTDDDVILINNPPGYYAANGNSAIVIPDGNNQTTLDVARRYQASYLVLEKDHVSGLDELYSSPRDVDGFNYLGSVNDAHIFRISQ